MTVELDNVVYSTARLRDGREIKTTDDYLQWVYEYLDSFSNEIGQEWTPVEIFPVWTRVMVEWCDTLSGIYDREDAQALAAAIGELTKCLNRVLTRLPDTRPVTRV